MTRLKWAGLLLAAIVFMQLTGVGPGDLWAMAVARMAKARDDTQALARYPAPSPSNWSFRRPSASRSPRTLNQAPFSSARSRITSQLA